MSSFVQDVANQNQYASGAVVSVAFPANVTAGNSIIWLARSDDYSSHIQSAIQVTDSQGNLYVQCGASYVLGTLTTLCWGYVKTIGASGPCTVTATVVSGPTNPSNNNYGGIYVQERAGIDQSAPYTSGESVSRSDAVTGTNATTSGLTPTLAAQPATLFGFAANNSANNPPVPGSGFTQRSQAWNGGSTAYTMTPEDRQLSSTVPVAALYSSTVGSDSIQVIAMVLKDAAAATGGGPLTGASQMAGSVPSIGAGIYPRTA